MVSALAAVILAGLMLIPMVNILVGLIAGMVLGGLGGGLLGAGLGAIITMFWMSALRDH